MVVSVQVSRVATVVFSDLQELIDELLNVNCNNDPPQRNPETKNYAKKLQLLIQNASVS